MAPAAGIDYRLLAEYLDALSYPVRLELLDLLRMPRTLVEIKLKPQRSTGGAVAAVASRPTVLAHLNKLVQVGLVKAQPTQQQGKAVPAYVVNPSKLYALTEDLRALSVRHAGRGASPDATGTLGGHATSDEVKGPHLVLVHGVYEGKVFRLDATTAGEDGRWVLGRKAGLPVSLDYDPYVSLENSVLASHDDRFTITDLAGSKNGTSVNWKPLEKGIPRPLKSGDILGVGRSLLCFVGE